MGQAGLWVLTSLYELSNVSQLLLHHIDACPRLRSRRGSDFPAVLLNNATSFSLQNLWEPPTAALQGVMSQGARPARP